VGRTDDLHGWAREDLEREVRTLRAVVSEHLHAWPGGDDPRGAGTPTGPGAVLLDARRAVLLEDVEVSLMQGYSDGVASGPLVSLALGGRINRSQEHTRTQFLFGAEGAAAIVGELLSLAGRMGEDTAAVVLGGRGGRA
jgi:hypothetical protein